jgi:hypothetical protein
MTDQHRATPEQWELLKRQGQTLGSAESIALLELRDRIAALEASAGIGQPVTPANTSAPADSLLERVQGAISDVEFPHGTDEARAAIREVARWLRSELVSRAVADRLEQEANH